MALIRYVFLFFAVYTYVFSPSVRALPLNPALMLIPVGLLYIVRQRKMYAFLKFYRLELALLMSIALFGMIRAVFLGEASSAISTLLIIFEGLVTSFFIVGYYLNNFKSDFIMTMVIPVLVLSSLFTIYLFFNPEVNELVKYQVLRYDRDTMSKFLLRGYGFGDELLYGYSLVHGIGCALCLLYLGECSFLILPALMFLFPVIVNARIGLMPVLAGILLMLGRANYKIVMLVVSVVLAAVFLTTMAPPDSDMAQVIKWATSFFSETSDFVHGSSEGSNYHALFNDMVVWPSSTREWVVGKGISIFTTQDASSDVGYILQLNFGGIFYLTLIMLLIFYMPLRAYLLNLKSFALFMLIVLLIGNIKGDIMTPTPTLRFLLLLYTYLLVHARRLSLSGFVSGQPGAIGIQEPASCKLS